MDRFLRRALTENLNLKILALLLAIGLVFVRAREKTIEQGFSGVRVELSNIPANMVQAFPERTFTATIVLYGPKNVLEYLAPRDLRFNIDLSQHAKKLVQDSRVLIGLGANVFAPNVDQTQRQLLRLDEEEIRPSQVLITVHRYDVTKDPPAIFASEASGDVLEIPLYQLIKTVPVRVPTTGEPQEGYKISISTTPEEVTITGPEAALSRIEEVTTSPVSLTPLTRSVTTDASLPEVAREDSPISATTTRVTIKVDVSRR